MADVNAVAAGDGGAGGGLDQLSDEDLVKVMMAITLEPSITETLKEGKQMLVEGDEETESSVMSMPTPEATYIAAAAVGLDMKVLHDLAQSAKK